MFKGIGKDFIKKCAETAIVLIDCKRELNFGIVGCCGVRLSEDLIEIVECFFLHKSK